MSHGPSILQTPKCTLKWMKDCNINWLQTVWNVSWQLHGVWTSSSHLAHDWQHDVGIMAVHHQHVMILRWNATPSLQCNNKIWYPRLNQIACHSCFWLHGHSITQVYIRSRKFHCICFPLNMYPFEIYLPAYWCNSTLTIIPVSFIL
jgi:hypothetical protein